MTAPPDRADAATAPHRGSLGAIGLMVAATVVGYLVYAVARDPEGTSAAVRRFDPAYVAPVLLTTLANYALRFAKWRGLLRQVGVTLPLRADALTYTAGLGLVVSPGKAGELIKPWLAREIAGAPLTRTLPVLLVERLTDAVAVLALAAIGVGAFAPEARLWVWGAAAAAAAATVAGSSPRFAAVVDGVLRRLPGGGRVAPPVAEVLAALRATLSPRGLAGALAISVVAWWAECVGYWLVFRGLGVSAGLGVATFLYAFATLFGAPSPGGVGMADAALVEGSLALIAGLSEGDAMAAALLIRAATLWFGVALGALVLLRLDAVVADGRRQLAQDAGPS